MRWRAAFFRFPPRAFQSVPLIYPCPRSSALGCTVDPVEVDVLLGRLEMALAGVEDREPRVVQIFTPDEVQRFRARGFRVYRALTRVSDDKLLSIRQQARECARYAAGEKIADALRPDASTPGIVDIVYNLGEHSGFSIDESSIMKQALVDVTNGEWDGLIARDSSRLGRDYWEKMGTIRDLRRAHVELHVLEDGGYFDYEDSINKVKSFANTWGDEGKKLEEIRKSMRATEAIRQARFPTTSLPFGYRSETDRVSRRKVWRLSEDAEKVRRIFEEMDAEPFQDQAALARRYGISRQLLRKILRNQAYTGGFNWKGEFIDCDPRVIPPIVSNDLFERVQQKLAMRRGEQTPMVARLR